MLGSSAYSSVWVKSPYEQIIRIDEIKEIPGTDLDLLHLASPTNDSRAVMPLGIPPFQLSPRPNDNCYAIGYSEDRDDKTEAALLRPDPAQCDSGRLCFTVSQSPRSCFVRIINNDNN